MRDLTLTEVKTSIGQSGFTLNQLNEISVILAEAKEMAVQTSLSVGDKVYVVQKTKKTLGIIKKLNLKKAQVTMHGGVVYNVPYSMLETANE